MADERYTVGQVLYVVSKKDNRVVPIRVVEEVTRRALEGEKRTYNVQVGPPGEKPIADIERLPGLIFRSVADVRAFMMKNATTAIDSMIKNAAASAGKWYGESVNAQQSQVDGLLDDATFGIVEESPAQSDASAESVEIQLPDGRIATARANVKIMPTQQS